MFKSLLRITVCVLLGTALMLCLIPPPEPAPEVHQEGATEARGPELPFMPFQVNPGARVPIIVWPNVESMSFASGLPFMVKGLFRLTPDGKPMIWVLGPWDANYAILTHEYQHYLEAKMPDQAQRLRDAFHDLCAPGFGIDHADLEAPVVKREGR